VGILSAVLIIAVAGIVGDTIVKLVKARSGGGGKLQSRLDQLTGQVMDQNAALEAAHTAIADQAAQIQELHERLDFVERLLTQSREKQGLGPGAPQDG
jgi:uncharacterized coiled-coil protein SlyX